MAKGQMYQAGSVAINMILNSAQFSAAIDKAKNAMSSAGVAMTRTMKLVQHAANKMGSTFKAVSSGIVNDIKGLGNAFKSLAQAAITPSSWVKGFVAVGASITAATLLAVNHRLELQKVADQYRHTAEEMNVFTYIAAATGTEYEKLADTLREIQVKANDIVEQGGQTASRMNEFFKASGGAKEWANLKDPLEVLTKFRIEYQKLVQTKGRGTATDLLDEIADSASECRKVLELTNSEFNRLVTMGVATSVSTANIEKFTAKFRELFEIGERFLVGIVNNIAPAFSSLINEWYSKIESALNGGGGKEGLQKAFQSYVDEWADKIFNFLISCIQSMEDFLKSLRKFMKKAMDAYNTFASSEFGQKFGLEITSNYDPKKLNEEDLKLHNDIQKRQRERDKLTEEHERKKAEYIKNGDSANKSEEQRALAKEVSDLQRKREAADKQHIEDIKEIGSLNARNAADSTRYVEDLTDLQKAQYASAQQAIAREAQLRDEQDIVQRKMVGKKKDSKESKELEADLKRINNELKGIAPEAQLARDKLDELDVSLDSTSQIVLNRQLTKPNEAKYAHIKDSDGGAAGLSSKVASGGADKAKEALKALEAFSEAIKAKRESITEFMLKAQGVEMSAQKQRELEEKKNLTALYTEMSKETTKYYKDALEKAKGNKTEILKLQREQAQAEKKIQEDKAKDLALLETYQHQQRIKGMTKASEDIDKQVREIEERYQLNGQSSQYTSERDQIERAMDESLEKMREEYKEYLEDVNSEEYKMYQDTLAKKERLLKEYDENALNRYLNTVSTANTASYTMATMNGKGQSPFPGMSNEDIEKSKNNVNQQTQYALQMSDNLIAESAKKNKKAFELKKKMDIANAIMSTYNAANSAMTSAPGPMGWAMAAMTVAMGLMNVQNIRAQEWTGQAHAGIDYVPAEGTWNLQKGERVLGPALNQDMTQFLKEQKAGNYGAKGGISISAPLHIEGNVVDEGWFSQKLDQHRENIAGLVSEYNSDRGI